MMNYDKFCPLILAGWTAKHGPYEHTDELPSYCVCRQACAWYDADKEACGVVSGLGEIAHNLFNVCACIDDK